MQPTLNLKLDWQSVCRALNIPFQGDTLPARVDCPCCGGSLVLYHDTAVGGEWHHCESCGITGDMVEMAANILGVDPESALFELLHTQELQSDAEEIDRYVNEHVRARHNIRAMWEKASHAMLNPPVDTLRTLRRLGMTAATDIERVSRPMSKIAGVVHYKKYNQYVRNMGPDKKQNGKNYIFRGRGWGNVMVIPYYHLPGHIIGFDLVGRHGHNDGDRIHTPAMQLQHLPKNAEAGLAGVSSVTGFHKKVIAVSDTVLMGQIQARSAHRDGALLPVVGWYDCGGYVTNSAWSMLEGAEVIFWDDNLNEKLLCQAMQTGGRVLISEVNYRQNERRHAAMLHNKPDGHGLLRELHDRAKTWTQTLKWYKTRVGGIMFNKLIAKVEARGHDIDRLNAICNKDGFSVMRRGILTPACVKTSDEEVVVDQNDEWLLESKRASVKTRKRLTNFTVRVERTFKDNGCRYLYGYVKQNGSKYAFLSPAEMLTGEKYNKTQGWLMDQTLEHGLQPLSVRAGWKDRLLELALKFHQPREVENTSLTEQRRELGL